MESDDPLILAIQRSFSSTWYNHVFKVGLKRRFFFPKNTRMYRIIVPIWPWIFTNFYQFYENNNRIIIEISSHYSQQVDRLLQSFPPNFSQSKRSSIFPVVRRKKKFIVWFVEICEIKFSYNPFSPPPRSKTKQHNREASNERKILPPFLKKRKLSITQTIHPFLESERIIVQSPSRSIHPPNRPTRNKSPSKPSPPRIFHRSRSSIPRWKILWSISSSCPSFPPLSVFRWRISVPAVKSPTSVILNDSAISKSF